MTKKSLLGIALATLAMTVGCAKGGNGAGNGISITVTNNNISTAYVTQSVQFQASVTGTTNTAVAWTLSGKACSGNPNPCGILVNRSTGIRVAGARLAAQCPGNCGVCCAGNRGLELHRLGHICCADVVVGDRDADSISRAIAALGEPTVIASVASAIPNKLFFVIIESRRISCRSGHSSVFRNRPVTLSFALERRDDVETELIPLVQQPDGQIVS